MAVFAIPAQARVLTNVFPDLQPYTQSLELGRFVLRANRSGPADQHAQGGHPPTPPGELHAGSVVALAAGEGVRGRLAFSDPQPRYRAGNLLLMPGHVGHIYRVTDGSPSTSRRTSTTITAVEGC